MLHIELAHPHQPANRSEAGACWERPGYKYNVTTTAFVCAAERHKACGEETQEETLNMKEKQRTKIRPSLRICFTSVNTKTT